MSGVILRVERSGGCAARLLQRAALVAVALSWLQSHGPGALAWGAPAGAGTPAAGPELSWQQQRQWLLQRNQTLQQQMELGRRCLQGADSLRALERCRQGHGWPASMPMHRGVDGPMVPWPGCPIW